MLSNYISSTSGDYYTIQPIYNNNDYDAFFMTVVMLAPSNTVNLFANS